MAVCDFYKVGELGWEVGGGKDNYFVGISSTLLLIRVYYIYSVRCRASDGDDKGGINTTTHPTLPGQIHPLVLPAFSLSALVLIVVKRKKGKYKLNCGGFGIGALVGWT